jgi:hypothetical protein
MSNDKDVKQGGVAAPVTSASAANAASAKTEVNFGDISETLAKMLTLLISREETALETEVQQKANKKKRAEAAEATEKQNFWNVMVAQTKCSHLKGNWKSAPRLIADQKIDFNVSYHNFIDGHAQIRCMSCGMRWKSSDTPEFLVRDGKKVPNHTRIGWNEGGPTGRGAIGLVQQSTNKMSSSEIPGAVLLEKKAPANIEIPADFQF